LPAGTTRTDTGDVLKRVSPTTMLGASLKVPVRCACSAKSTVRPQRSVRLPLMLMCVCDGDAF
jgi:hypothetical protein